MSHPGYGDRDTYCPTAPRLRHRATATRTHAGRRSVCRFCGAKIHRAYRGSGWWYVDYFAKVPKAKP